jgi:flagellin-specific chaperone FliS
MDRITFANRHGNPEAVAEVIKVLTPLREAWKVAVPQAAQEQAAQARGR